MDNELYLPRKWFGEDFAQLYKEGHIPEEKTFSTKYEIIVKLLNQAIHSGLVKIRWNGCDAAYGNNHVFLDGQKLPEGIWYFAEANAKEQVFSEYPQMSYPKTKRSRPRKIYTSGLFADSEKNGKDTGKYKNRIRSGRRGAYYLCGGHIFSQKVQKRYKIQDSRKSRLSKIPYFR